MTGTTPNVDTIICGDCLEEMGEAAGWVYRYDPLRFALWDDRL